jgi:hypothetical protein
LRILGTIQDVSSKKEIEEELISAKKYSRTIRAIKRAADKHSHEIRTPEAAHEKSAVTPTTFLSR